MALDSGHGADSNRPFSSGTTTKSPLSSLSRRPHEHGNFAHYGAYRESQSKYDDADVDADDVSMASQSPSVEDAEMLSDSQNTDCSTPSVEMLDADRHKSMTIPKLKDIAFDRVQAQSVFQHSEHLPTTDQIQASSHFSNVAQSTRDPSSTVIYKRRRLGFDAQELLLNGALNCSPCRPSNLVYAPRLNLFREENFLDTPQNVLDVLKPALALAELILLKGNPRFWVDVGCGTRMPDAARSKQTSTHVERLVPVAEITEAVQVAALSRLQEFGRLTTFRFEPLKNQYGRAVHPTFVPCSAPAYGHRTHGQIRPSDQPLPRHQAVSANPWEQQGVIIVDSNFYTAAKTFSKQRFPDVAAQLRFTFFFAVNLLHEIAHSFDSKCGGGHYYDLITKDRTSSGSMTRSYLSRLYEPTYKDYKDHEMGLYFEYETFGGRVHPINIDFSAKYGLNVYFGNEQAKPSQQGIQATEEGLPYSWAVPMGYIEELHQQLFWDNEPRASGLRIPMQGVHGYGLNTTSTVSWRDHLLAKDAAHVFEQIEISFEEQTRVSKRQKLDSPTATQSQQRKPQKQRRLRQRVLRSFSTKAEAAAADAKAMLLSKAQGIDDDGVGPRLNADDTVSTTARYNPPPPKQPAIDDALPYLNSEDHLFAHEPQLDPASELYDPLLKRPHELSASDKWLLLEDYALVTTQWDSRTFLTKRAMLETYRGPSPGPNLQASTEEDEMWPLHPLPRRLLPDHDNPNNWTAEDCNNLRRLRETHPDKGLLVDRKKRKADRDKEVQNWRVQAEKEELLVRMGGSRVVWLAGGESMRMEEERVGLKAMSDCEFQNWEGKWRVMLMKIRAEQESKQSIAVVESGAAMGVEGGDINEADIHVGEGQGKITDFFGIAIKGIETDRIRQDQEVQEEGRTRDKLSMESDQELVDAAVEDTPNDTLDDTMHNAPPKSPLKTPDTAVLTIPTPVSVSASVTSSPVSDPTDRPTPTPEASPANEKKQEQASTEMNVDDEGEGEDEDENKDEDEDEAENKEDDQNDDEDDDDGCDGKEKAEGKAKMGEGAEEEDNDDDDLDEIT